MTARTLRQWVTIALAVAALLAVVVLKRSCGQAVGQFVEALGPPVADGGAERRGE